MCTALYIASQQCLTVSRSCPVEDSTDDTLKIWIVVCARCHSERHCEPVMQGSLHRMCSFVEMQSRMWQHGMRVVHAHQHANMQGTQVMRSVCEGQNIQKNIVSCRALLCTMLQPGLVLSRQASGTRCPSGSPWQFS